MITVTSVVSGCVFIFTQFLDVGMLGQLYGMLNSTQIIVYLPLFLKLVFPKNAEIVNVYLI